MSLSAHELLVGDVVEVKMAVPPWWIALVLAVGAIPSAYGNDQEKAERQLSKMTAMATDATGRQVVNASMAETLHSSRMALVYERRYLKLNYGCLFVARALMASGTEIGYLDQQLRAGKNIFQIASDRNADWRRILKDAKKLNRKIEENLYLHFLHIKHSEAKNNADSYELRLDGVPADNNVADHEILRAQTIYDFLHERASQVSGARAGDMDIVHQQAARMDHARLGGPQAGGGSIAPEAGGIPSK